MLYIWEIWSYAVDRAPTYLSTYDLPQPAAAGHQQQGCMHALSHEHPSKPSHAIMHARQVHPCRIVYDHSWYHSGQQMDMMYSVSMVHIMVE